MVGASLDSGSIERVGAAAPAIRARGLVRRFGQVCAVDGIDLDVPTGSIFAVLGHNGAGKTTLIHLLTTLLRPDAGEASVAGHDIVADAPAVREAIAVTGQFASLDEDLTGAENLVLLARLQGLSRRAARDRAAVLLAGFELAAAARKQVADYSGGMRRRLDIAASLVVTPRVLFLDEPTTGLDPSARQGVWRMIRQLADSGVTILLTTQYLEEADQLANRIAVMDSGRKIAEGSSRELKSATGSGWLRIGLAQASERESAEALLLERFEGLVLRSAEGAELSVVGRSARESHAVVSTLLDAGIEVVEFALGSPSLDDVFFALTDGSAAPGDAESQQIRHEGVER